MSEYINKGRVIEKLSNLRDDYLDSAYEKKDDEVFVALMRAYARVTNNCIEIVKKVPVLGTDEEGRDKNE